MSTLPKIVPAAVTAFSPGGERVLLDFVPQHLAYLEHHGADGVLTLGTNGEGVSLSMEERREVIDAVITHRGSLSVFAGTGCASLPETVALSSYAIERGVDGVMIVPPFYFKDVPTVGLIAYYEAHINAWDCLAGLLLVTEAGGWTNDFLANDGLVSGNPVLASGPGMVDHIKTVAGVARDADGEATPADP